MKKTLLSIATISLLTTALSASNDFLNEYAIGVKAGTSGVGIELTTGLFEDVNARLSISGLKYTKSLDEEDINYDADLSLLNIALLADYYMMSSSQFRLTGGVIYNGNKLTMNGKPSDSSTFTINDTVYSSNDVSTIDASVDFNKVAPYIGIGWGNGIKSAGWNFTMDAGAIYQGSASVDISATTTLTGTDKTTLEQDIAQERKDLENDLSSLKIYPIATIGVSYRF